MGYIIGKPIVPIEEMLQPGGGIGEARTIRELMQYIVPRMRRSLRYYLHMPITNKTKNEIRSVAKSYLDQANVHLRMLGMTEQLKIDITFSDEAGYGNIAFTPVNWDEFMRQQEALGL